MGHEETLSEPTKVSDSCFVVYDGFFFDFSKKEFLNSVRNQSLQELFDSTNEFSFLFIDKEKKEVVVGRDKIGSKPLFLGKKRNKFVFCSEKHSLLKHGFSEVNAIEPGSCMGFSSKDGELLWKEKKAKLSHKDTDFRQVKELGRDFSEKFNRSLEKRTKGLDEVAVAFSGGVDSSFLSTKLSNFVDVKLFTIGLKGSHDLEWSKKASSILGLDHEVIELSFEEIKELIKPTLDVVADANRLKIGVGLTFYKLSKEIKDKGYSVLFSGQGSDELFLGYDKYRRRGDPKKAMVRDLKNIAEENLERDEAVCMENGVELRNPYLDINLVDFALSLPYEINLPEKRVVREAAKETLPKEIWKRDKKSIQYGTKIDREIDRIARRNGYKRKIGNHVDKYLTSLSKELFPSEVLQEISDYVD